MEKIMKRSALVAVLLLLHALLSACAPADSRPVLPGGSEGQEEPGNGGGDPDVPQPGEEPRTLILYCSRSGNTQRVAREIADQTGGEVLEVVPAEPYEEGYDAMLARAQQELAEIDRGNYPPVSTVVERFDDYDLLIVGYPIWYGSMATPMQSFLHEHAAKLSGKRVALFATSGSSGMAASVAEARALCPDSEVLEPTLLLTSADFPLMENSVREWLGSLDLTQNDHNDNDDMQSNTIRLTVNGRSFTATLEDNSSARALAEHLAQGDLQVLMEDYGDMEKVGPLGFSLPRNDVRITTTPGDLILYQGNMLTIYYDVNTWSFTRLGHVDGVSTRDEMLELLGGKGTVTVTLSAGTAQ